MINILRIRFHQFLEEAKQKSLTGAFKKAVGKCIMTDRIVVPVYNDFSGLNKVRGQEGADLEFMVVDGRNLGLAENMMKTSSRRLKLSRNIKDGYYAYTVAMNGEIIGDIWCATRKSVGRVPIHPDLPWLGIECEDSDAYMFDMYVVPDSRGKVTTSYLLGKALNHLKNAGYTKVYGFYEKDNLPALWTHRLFGYSELGKRRSFRFLFYKKTETVTV